LYQPSFEGFLALYLQGLHPYTFTLKAYLLITTLLWCNPEWLAFSIALKESWKLIERIVKC
jgi:hypothetical protein